MGRISPLVMLWLLLPRVSCAWGAEGHRVVAEVAWNHLSAAVRHKVLGILGSDDLAAISTWADEIRSQRPETYGWHFVDIPGDSNGFLEARDCYRPGQPEPAARSDHHNCVVDRIEIFERILADGSTPAGSRREAAKFLVHFVADVHQPLHAIGDARGGNDIQVWAFGSRLCGSRPCNLHVVWDSGLIAHTRTPEREYAAHLEHVIARKRLKGSAGGTPEDWANESFHIARQVWLNNGGEADDAYFRRNVEIMDEQLALAGLRLARVLNRALAGNYAMSTRKSKP